MKVRISITGDAPLDAALAGMREIFSDRIRREANMKAARIVRNRARELVPELGGNTKRSIIIRTELTGSKVTVGPTRRKGFKASFIEFGTAPHRITSPTGLFGRNGKFLGKAVMHPGSAPRPFMRPAFAQTVGQMSAEVKKQLKLKLRTFLRRTIKK